MTLEVVKRICADDSSDMPILIVAPDVSVLEGSWMSDAKAMQMDKFKFHPLNSRNVSF